MASTAVQAASWALATEMAAMMGGGTTVVEIHPGGGMYDVLLVTSTAALDGKDAVGVYLMRKSR